MHPKIKELALQAGGSHYPEVGGTTLEKFGKLIIQECLEIVEDEDDGSQDTLAVRWAMHRIRKHFGVEE